MHDYVYMGTTNQISLKTFVVTITIKFQVNNNTLRRFEIIKHWRKITSWSIATVQLYVVIIDISKHDLMPV